MPVVSAIITTFNRANYLETAICSVLKQDFNDFELIILDNSSTDNTESIIAGFVDPRIRTIKHPHLTISQTRNLGVKEAKGNFIAFLDDDDEWLPNKLSSELSLFEKMTEDVALVYGGFVRIDTEGKQFYTHTPILQGKVLKELLSLKDDFTGSASNPMIRKSAIVALGGFDESVNTGEDWEFYLRLAEYYQIRFVPEEVVAIRHHFGVRLGDRLRDYIDLEEKVMQRFAAIFDADNKLKSFYLQRIGGKYLRLGETYNGRKYIRRAIRCFPSNRIAYIQLLLSFFKKNTYSAIHRIYLNQKRSIKV